MNLINLKKVNNFEVERWLERSIKDLTPYQKERLSDDEIIRFAPFYFMERRQKTDNILMRFSILFIIPVFIFILIGLPINYFITGSWGYNYEKMRWFSKWVSACGL
jgi:hypothetical protein